MRKKVIILQGPPASGKSTFAKQWVAERPEKRVRVNRDDIRRMLGPYWIPTREKLVDTVEDNLIMAGILQGYDVIVDATNYNRTEASLAHISGICKCDVRFIEMPFIPLNELIQRDLNREHSVGRDVIEYFFNKKLKRNE